MSNREYESRESNQNRNDESSSSFILGALIGGMVGAAAALLFAPKSGKELRKTLTEQAGPILDKTGQLRENVASKSSELASKTASLSQGIVLQSSELVNKVKGKPAPKEESDPTYISLQQGNGKEDSKKPSEAGHLNSDEIRRKLEEAQKAFDEEENKVKL